MDAEAEGEGPTLTPGHRDSATYQFVVSLAGRLSPGWLAEAEQGFPPADPGGMYYVSAYEQFLHGLRFRHEMHQEFAR